MEIALVLAREMRSAAERDVEASLRLEQLREVFGAEQLDRAERARIQTALQMAGLEPSPSLLEADPSQPITFTVEKGAGMPAAPAAKPAEPAERQDFPTVGEFAKSAFGRFRRKREATADVATAMEAPIEPTAHGPQPTHEPTAHGPQPTDLEDEAELGHEEPEPAAEETAIHEVVADEESVVDEPPVTTNGHAPTNGWAHLDFDGGGLLDDVVVPEDEPEYEPTAHGPQPTELEHEAEHEHEELEPEPEPAAYFEPSPVAPAPAPEALGIRRPALLFAAVAVPVVVASFAGWAFGLAFVALGLIATGALRNASLGTVLRAGAAVTIASLGVAILLANLDSGGDDTSDRPVSEQPKAEQPKQETPAAEEPAPEPDASTPAPKPEKSAESKPKRETGPPPDDETEGLVRVPAGQEPSGQSTTPTTPGAVPPAAEPQQP